MAQKKFLDLNGLLYFWNKVKGYVDSANANKVDKVSGKGLSTNDYTNEEKQKLAGLNNYTLPTASSETLGGVKVGAGLNITGDGILSATGGGTADAVAWENVIGKPENVSEFTNDAGYQTASDVDNKLTAYAKKTDISAVYRYKGSVANYAALPVADQQVGDTYNVQEADSSHNIKAGDNVSWNGTDWDILSGTVDLSGYVEDADLVAITNEEIDTAMA